MNDKVVLRFEQILDTLTISKKEYVVLCNALEFYIGYHFKATDKSDAYLKSLAFFRLIIKNVSDIQINPIFGNAIYLHLDDLSTFGSSLFFYEKHSEHKGVSDSFIEKLRLKFSQFFIEYKSHLESLKLTQFDADEYDYYYGEYDDED